MKLRSPKEVPSRSLNKISSKRKKAQENEKENPRKKSKPNLRFDFAKINSQSQSRTPSPPRTPSSQSPEVPMTPIHSPVENRKINLREKAAPKGSMIPAKTATLNEYLDLNNPAAYSGRVADHLKSIESVSRHKRRLKKFRRRKVYVGGPYTQIQADLIHYRNYARQNNGYKYILAVIDCFSRKNYCRPMKTATAAETARNLDDILSSMKYTPTQFSSDNGNEFHVKNPEIFKILVQKYGMVIFTLKAPLKASMVERFIRTLKERIERYFTQNGTFKWIDVLQKLSSAINNTVNRSIGMAPNEVNFENREEVFKKLYDSWSPPVLCKFQVGDTVRIPEDKREFAKGYKPNWSKELFKIRRKFSNNSVCYYKLKTIDGTSIPRSYYEQELNFVARNGTH